MLTMEKVYEVEAKEKCEVCEEERKQGMKKDTLKRKMGEQVEEAERKKGEKKGHTLKRVTKEEKTEQE